MKVTHNHLRIVIVALGLGLIALGITKKIFDFEISERVSRWISTGVIIVAAGIFVYSRRLANNEPKVSESQNKPVKK
ncbi:MAG TPA: hypothetical protein VF857_10220 [Spirochaetota bacterium]